MPVYLLTLANETERRLHVLCFECDVEEKNVVALIFTSRHSAEDYVSMAGWQDNYSIEENEPTELLKNLILAREHGVTHVAIEPKRDEQLEGKPPMLRVLNDPYEVHADILSLLRQKLESVAAG